VVTRIYSVYDTKAEVFSRPMLFVNALVAKRSFMQDAMDPNHQFAKNPGDYRLYEIGEFDDTKCEIKTVEKIDLGSAADHQPKGRVQ